MLSTYSSIELQPQIYRFGGTGIWTQSLYFF
jgi:hypothetical protein